MSHFLGLIERINTPAGWLIALLLTAPPLVIGVLRSIFTFHNEFVLHRRAKNIDRALSSLPTSTAEHDLLVECRAQEAVLINIGLRLSSMERSIVLRWVQSAPVTLDLVRRSWPQITWEEGVLFPRLSWLEKLYMWYSIVAGFFLLLAGALLLLMVFKQAVTGGNLQLFLLPVGLFLTAALLFKQIEGCVGALRLISRLERFGLSNNAPRPTEPAVDGAGG